LKALLDTNVVLDLLLDRQPFSKTAGLLFAKVFSNRIDGYLCATTLTTIHYLVQKHKGDAHARTEIGKLFSLFEIAPVQRNILEKALNSVVSSFEDAVIYQAALYTGVDSIVTRNLKDFRRAELTIYAPEELLMLLAAEDAYDNH